jgi:hypothetical protein
MVFFEHFFDHKTADILTLRKPGNEPHSFDCQVISQAGRWQKTTQKLTHAGTEKNGVFLAKKRPVFCRLKNGFLIFRAAF